MTCMPFLQPKGWRFWRRFWPRTTW